LDTNDVPFDDEFARFTAGVVGVAVVVDDCLDLLNSLILFFNQSLYAFDSLFKASFARFEQGIEGIQGRETLWGKVVLYGKWYQSAHLGYRRKTIQLV
jgi:hypothetical protein